jgi:hypothetical protein
MAKINTKFKFNHSQILIIISMSAIIVVILAIFTTLHFQNKFNKLSVEFEQYKIGYQTKIFSLGDSIDTAEFSLVVNSVDVDNDGIPGYLPAPEGMKYLAIDISLRNKTDSENIFLPLFETYLRDSEGTRYELTVAPNVESGVAGRIAAGDTVKGQVGFLVPETANNLRFYFEPFSGVTDTVVVELNI